MRDASLAAFKTARDAAAREVRLLPSSQLLTTARALLTHHFICQRDVLLSSGAASASTSSGHASASASASAASASLRRTRALMAAELSRGGATLSVQAASAGALTQAAGQYDAQRGALATGRGSLSALRRAASADRAILWVGSLLFCGVVTHIGIKRTPFLARLHPARRAAVAARAAERVKWDATREAKAAGRGAAAGTQGDAEAAYQPPPPPPLPPSPPAAPLPEVLQPPPPLDADVLAPPRSLLVSDWGATALLLDDSPFVGAEAADGDPAHILGDAVASENELPLQPEAVHFEL